MKDIKLNYAINNAREKLTKLNQRYSEGADLLEITTEMIAIGERLKAVAVKFDLDEEGFNQE